MQDARCHFDSFIFLLYLIGHKPPGCSQESKKAGNRKIKKLLLKVNGIKIVAFTLAFSQIKSTGSSVQSLIYDHKLKVHFYMQEIKVSFLPIQLLKHLEVIYLFQRQSGREKGKDKEIFRLTD